VYFLSPFSAYWDFKHGERPKDFVLHGSNVSARITDWYISSSAA